MPLQILRKPPPNRLYAFFRLRMKSGPCKIVYACAISVCLIWFEPRTKKGAAAAYAADLVFKGLWGGWNGRDISQSGLFRAVHFLICLRWIDMVLCFPCLMQNYCLNRILCTQSKSNNNTIPQTQDMEHAKAFPSECCSPFHLFEADGFWWLLKIVKQASQKPVWFGFPRGVRDL